MSDRRHWPDVVSSVVSGDAITGCRDNDTRTYRLFVNKGFRYVKVGSSTTAHQLESCKCCDLSIEDLRQLSDILLTAIAAHEPWPELEDL